MVNIKVVENYLFCSNQNLLMLAAFFSVPFSIVYSSSKFEATYYIGSISLTKPVDENFSLNELISIACTLSALDPKKTLGDSYKNEYEDKCSLLKEENRMIRIELESKIDEINLLKKEYDFLKNGGI